MRLQYLHLMLIIGIGYSQLNEFEFFDPFTININKKILEPRRFKKIFCGKNFLSETISFVICKNHLFQILFNLQIIIYPIENNLKYLNLKNGKMFALKDATNYDQNLGSIYLRIQNFANQIPEERRASMSIVYKDNFVFYTRLEFTAYHFWILHQHSELDQKSSYVYQTKVNALKLISISSYWQSFVLGVASNKVHLFSTQHLDRTLGHICYRSTERMLTLRNYSVNCNSDINIFIRLLSSVNFGFMFQTSIALASLESNSIFYFHFDLFRFFDSPQPAVMINLNKSIKCH